MKKSIAISILGFIICTAFNNPRKLVADYRDAYVGTYFCKSYCNNLDGNTKQSFSTNDTLSIVISKDNIDSVLQIKLDTKVLKVKLANTYLKAYQAGMHCGGNFYAADSLNLIYALNMANSCRYKGKKK